MMHIVNVQNRTPEAAISYYIHHSILRDLGVELSVEQGLAQGLETMKKRSARALILQEDALEQLSNDAQCRDQLANQRQQTGTTVIALVSGECDREDILNKIENLPVDVVASHYGQSEIVRTIAKYIQHPAAFTPTFPLPPQLQEGQSPTQPLEILTGITAAGKTTIQDLLFDYLDVRKMSGIEPVVRIKIASGREERRNDDRVKRERTIILPDQHMFDMMKRSGEIALEYVIEKKDGDEIVERVEYGSRTPNNSIHELYTSGIDGAVRMLKHYNTYNPGFVPSPTTRPIRVFGLSVSPDEAFERMWERLLPDRRTKQAAVQRKADIDRGYNAYGEFMARCSATLGYANVVQLPSYATTGIRILMPQQEREEPALFTFNVKRYVARQVASEIAQTNSFDTN